MFHLSKVSGNEKTGPIPVSTSSRATCPPSCAFFAKGCYAKGGPLALHWAKVTSGERGTEMPAFLAQIRSLPSGQLWRHNQAGDLPGKGNRINRRQLDQLAKANQGRRGWTYTHKPVIATRGVSQEVIWANRAAVKSALRQGFAINLSGNSPAHADKLASLGLPTVCVVPEEIGRAHV